MSLVVMMPLERIAIFMGTYFLFLLWGRLLAPAAQQVWRLKWLLIILFAFDWWLISLDLAVIICVRLILLTGIFALFFQPPTRVNWVWRSKNCTSRIAMLSAWDWPSKALVY